MLLKEAMKIWRSYSLVQEANELNLLEQEQQDIWLEKAKEMYGVVGAQKMLAVLKSKNQEEQTAALKDLIQNQRQFISTWAKSKKEKAAPSQQVDAPAKQEEIVSKIEQGQQQQDQIEQKKEEAEQQNQDSLASKLEQEEIKSAEERASTMAPLFLQYFSNLRSMGADTKKIGEAAVKLASPVQNDNSHFGKIMRRTIYRAANQENKNYLQSQGQ